ncbi:MAG: hypothetical protein U1E39_06175 [Planctomycetota bacterium]
MGHPTTARTRAAARVGIVAGVLLAAAVAGPVRPASACPWDYDTLVDETVWFPGVIDVLAGAYVRHSDLWYAWRARDRERRLGIVDASSARGVAAGDVAAIVAPTAPADLATRLRWMDDLVIAYDHLERHDEAVATARAALALDPARYESRSNLGVALVHAGRGEEGIASLRAALEVNAEGHFGRMRTAIEVLEYVEAHRVDGAVTLPLFPGRTGCRAPEIGLAAYLAGRRTPEGETVVPLSRIEREQAAEVVVGMIFTGRPDDPALLECLGHLLADPDRDWDTWGDAANLAARAFLAAARVAPGADVRDRYRALARQVLASQRARDEDGRDDVVSLARVEAEFDDERALGDASFAEIRADEARFLASSADPEAAFRAKYAGVDVAGFNRVPAATTPTVRPTRRGPEPVPARTPPIPALGVTAILVATATITGWLSGRRRPAPRGPRRARSAGR